jgi:hypothetical protein
VGGAPFVSPTGRFRVRIDDAEAPPGEDAVLTVAPGEEDSEPSSIPKFCP